MYNDERTGVPAEPKPVPPRRRRRRKRRPKWMRVLRKYWPPIRFALICILLLVLLFNLGKAVVNLIAGDGKEKPTDPTGTSQVEENMTSFHIIPALKPNHSPTPRSLSVNQAYINPNNGPLLK